MSDSADYTERVYVRFHDDRPDRIDYVHGPTAYEARLDAYAYARALRERPEVENAFRLEHNEIV